MTHIGLYDFGKLRSLFKTDSECKTIQGACLRLINCSRLAENFLRFFYLDSTKTVQDWVIQNTNISKLI